MKHLLNNIYYGNELPKLEAGSKSLQDWFSSAWPRLEKQERDSQDWPVLFKRVRDFFRRPRPGLFDGPITAGDGIAIAAFMSALRPKQMIEIGAASGFSSAFILDMAEGLGLLQKDEVFLQSLDIVAVRPNGNRTGDLLRTLYPQHDPHWKLHAPATSVDILNGHLERLNAGENALAFIDGGHTHPWPVTDVIAMRKQLPKGSWILLQDVQIMERWIADCVIHSVPSAEPVRGAQLAVSLWPGTKWIGQGMSYNMAAIKLDIDDEAFATYVRSALDYADEIPFEHRELLLALV